MITTLRKGLLGVAIWLAMMSIGGAFVFPNPTFESVDVVADCTAYTIHAKGSVLTIEPEEPRVVAYKIVLTPPSGPAITVTGSMPVVFPDPLPAGSSFSFDLSETKTWASLGLTLTGGYSLSGTADLISGGVLRLSTGITFTPTILSCEPPPQPHLIISKDPKTGTFNQGAQASFTIVVGNDGGSSATNVMLHDQLPINGGLWWATYTASQGSCVISGSSVLDCNLGTIAPGGSVTVTVKSPVTTPGSACTLQPNPVALATADGGLQAQDFGELSCTPPPLPCPAGSFTFSFDISGNLGIIFDQFPAPNDNSYGVNAVGWSPRRGHLFKDLVNSDHAGFQIVDPGGQVRLSFNIDYLTASPTAPSGYASLGPFGGDGGILVGSLTPADISWTTSLANNLNNINIPGLFNAAHVQQFGSVNVLIDSPPTDPLHQTYTNSDPLLAGWDFHDTYYVVISAAKLASLGFGSGWKVEPNLSALHNSPAKPCPPASTGGESLTVLKKEVKDKQVKITLFNDGAVDEAITALQLSWPASNGKLVQVKLDGDVIYDNPDIPAPSANLTLAQLVADVKKRTIKHGESDVLILIFEHNASGNLASYTGTVSTSGFALTILP